MKSKTLKTVVSLFIIMIVSCNEPETVVTDIVHPDGSVTRKIEMRYSKKDYANLSMKNLQIPFDSSWAVKDSMEIGVQRDTVMVKRAEKLFASVDQLNLTYKNDSSGNREASRHAEFKKQFRWFNTDYIFSESIDKNLSFGYPASDFFNKEQLSYFYLPEKIRQGKRYGPDSLKYKALEDTIDKRQDMWGKKSLISEWIGEFSRLSPEKPEKELSYEALKLREAEFVASIDKYSHSFDSLWTNGIILRDFFGEPNALKYRSLADSAMALITKKVMISFSNYSVKIIMPGKLTGTNGFMDSSHVLLWPVKSDYFFTEPYRMWAESKTTNTWAWIVTGLFLVFVAAGLIIRRIKK